MTLDFLTEECESGAGWGDFGRDSGECMYVYPGDHCEYARKVMEEKGENKPVLPAEFADQMEALALDGDEEARHALMDELMCHVLISLGYKDGIEIFNRTDKYYV